MIKHAAEVQAVRQKCAHCKWCDPVELELILLLLAEADSLLHLLKMGDLDHVATDAYTLVVNGNVKVRFIWDEPFAYDLNLLCFQ